ncbi:uncharacterized protein LOC134672173 [Cydia fagiglandana]|uniref:uncharacterized protein LOC134672173 n=1 Tax=Cydia fagiglandana TaxID=1458189 RepID=UPI002FEE5EED
MTHLEQFLQQYANREHIVCGDLNGWHTTWGSVRNNDRGREIHDLAIKFDLISCNIGNEPTFETEINKHGQIRHSIVDLTLATPRTANNILDWKVNKEIIPSSDHHGIEFKIKSDNIRHNKKKSTSTYKYQTDKTNWDNFKTKLKENFDASNILGTDIDELDNNGLDNYINEMTNVILKTCDATLTLKKPHQKIPWWTQELTDLKKKVISLHHRLQDLKRSKKDITNILKELHDARAEYSNKIRTTSSDHFREFCSRQGRDDVWSVTNRLLKSSPQPQPPATLKTDNGTYTTSILDTAERLAAKFFPEDTAADDTLHHMHIRETVANNIVNNEPAIRNNEPQFTTQEVLDIIKNMSPKRAPGIDHLTADICKQSIECYAETITKRTAFHHGCPQ